MGRQVLEHILTLLRNESAEDESNDGKESSLTLPLLKSTPSALTKKGPRSRNEYKPQPRPGIRPAVQVNESTQPKT